MTTDGGDKKMILGWLARDIFPAAGARWRLGYRVLISRHDASPHTLIARRKRLMARADFARILTLDASMLDRGTRGQERRLPGITR